MLKNIKAVIFDLDGTLIDSMWIWNSIDIEYLARFNSTLPSDLHSAIEGMSFTETAVYFKNRFNIKDSLEKMKNDWNEMAWEYYKTKVPLKNNVNQFLDFLRKIDMKMGIGTSNSKELVELVLNRYQIKNYFYSIRTSCEVKKGKPHPDIYLKVADDLNVLPKECLVFEDVPNGVIAAKNAGMKVCGVFDQCSKHLQERIIQLSDYYINDFSEVITNIKDEDNYEQIFAD